jgi:hypothetical protein
VLLVGVLARPDRAMLQSVDDQPNTDTAEVDIGDNDHTLNARTHKITRDGAAHNTLT